MIEVEEQGYKLRLKWQLTPQQLDDLVSLIRQPGQRPSVVLGGRGGVRSSELKDFGRVVVKEYRRGGFLAHFVRNRYVHWGRIRSWREFELLDQARSRGIRVVEPLGWASRGEWLYRAWLFTREVEHHRTLADLASRGDIRVSEYTERFAIEVMKLVQNRILHVDLHPGNVLVDPAGQVWLVDFDKAREFSGDPKDLCDQYIIRWRRAVIKHALPDELSEIVCMHLRKQVGN